MHWSFAWVLRVVALIVNLLQSLLACSIRSPSHHTWVLRVVLGEAALIKHVRRNAQDILHVFTVRSPARVVVFFGMGQAIDLSLVTELVFVCVLPDLIRYLAILPQEPSFQR